MKLTMIMMLMKHDHKTRNKVKEMRGMRSRVQINVSNCKTTKRYHLYVEKQSNITRDIATRMLIHQLHAEKCNPKTRPLSTLKD